MTDDPKTTTHHEPVTTLADLLVLDDAELVAGYFGAECGDPEPGMNHSRAYHHGWRMHMMDLGEIEIPQSHRRLTRDLVAHQRGESAGRATPERCPMPQNCGRKWCDCTSGTKKARSLNTR